MRWVLVAAYLSAAAVATWAQVRQASEAQLAIELEAGYALPEAADTYNVVNDRLWKLMPHVAVRSLKHCAKGELELRQNGQAVGSSEWYRRQVAPGVIDVTRGRVVVGLPECNGYHAILQRGRRFVGGYDPNGRGSWSTGRSVIIARADEHAAGFVPTGLDLRVIPVGIRCVECPLSLPASFAVRSSRRRVAVRVYAGSMFVGRFSGRYVRVRAGEQLFAQCATPQTCRLGRPMLFQPREPFILAPRRPRPLSPVIRGGDRPPDELLAPERADAEITQIRERGKPKLLAVEWSRYVRIRSGLPVDFGKGRVVLHKNVVSLERGLIVWLRTAHAWRRTYARRYPQWFNLDVRAGDVTRDGLKDLLLTESQGGTSYCGVRRVVADVAGQLRDIFHRYLCETDIAVHGRDLLVPTPIGPCPFRQGPVHCYGGLRNELFRWNGRRLVLRRIWVSCQRADLDPNRGCVNKT